MVMQSIMHQQCIQMVPWRQSSKASIPIFHSWKLDCIAGLSGGLTIDFAKGLYQDVAVAMPEADLVFLPNAGRSCAVLTDSIIPSFKSLAELLKFMPLHLSATKAGRSRLQARQSRGNSQ